MIQFVQHKKIAKMLSKAFKITFTENNFGKIDYLKEITTISLTRDNVNFTART